MIHDLSTRRIRYIGRDHYTPVYHPVQEREDILPIAEEFSGPRRLLTWAVMVLVGIAFWAALFAWWLS